MIRLALIAAALLASAASHAAWVLDNEASSLGFVSVKAGNVGEVHRFGKLTGGISPDGAADVAVHMASVDTLIPIRDERMREILFEVASFPTAHLTAQLDLAPFEALSAGEVLQSDVSGTLKVKDAEVGVLLPVTVARLSERRMLVTTRQPVVISAASVGLVEGLEKLREIAGLPSISQAVPVTFALVFDREQAPVSLRVSDARIRAPLPGQDKTVAYFSATNEGAEPVVIVAASSESARAIELHTIVRDGDMVRMRRLKEVVIAPGETKEFAPGGHHLMVFGVSELPEEVAVVLRDSEGRELAIPFARFSLS